MKPIDMIWGKEEPQKTETKEAPAKAEIFREPSFVETVQNRIYFYSEIGKTEILQLNRRLRELNNSLLYDANIQEREPAQIFLHINSYGGSIFAGLSGMDEIAGSKVPVITIVDGCCASAATFLSVVGHKRVIRPNAFMLIHQLSAMSWGKFRELQDDNINHTRLMKTIKGIYLKYTKVPEKKIDEILDHDIWFDAKTCLKYGLVDEIR